VEGEAKVRLRDLVKGSEADPSVATEATHGSPPLAAAPKAIPDPKWLIVKSRLLDGEQILVVFEKKHLKEAENAHPDKVIYFPPEIEELRRHRGTPDFPQLLRTVHLVKKRLGGWVVPSGAARGGDSGGSTKRRAKAG